MKLELCLLSNEKTVNKFASAKIRREVVCKNWLQGLCSKSLKCNFLHLYDDTRMPYCKLKKKYLYCFEKSIGVCPLKHMQEKPGESFSALTANTYQNSTRINYGNQQQDLCIKYLFGYCPAGPNCTSKHIQLSADKLPNAYLPSWYLRSILIDPSLIRMIQDDQAKKANQTWINYLANLQNTMKSNLHGTLESDNISSMAAVYHAGQRMNTIFGNDMKIRCFIIKSGKIENILTSVQRGIWATSKSNMHKFNEAFNTCDHVIFLMSANESGGFQGYARMATGFINNLYPGIWGSFGAKLSPNFRIQWLKQAKLDFEAIEHYTNPWNDNKPLKKSRDGQEMPLDLAQAICNKLDALPSEDLLQGTPMAAYPRINHETFFKLSAEKMVEEETKLGLYAIGTNQLHNYIRKK